MSLWLPKHLRNEDGFFGVEGSSGGFAEGEWPDWDEMAEDTLKNFDLCVFMESASGDETGFSYTGSITGANLVLTHRSGFGAATGSPPYRYGSGYFSATEPCAESFIIGGNSFFFCWKVGNPIGSGSNVRDICAFYGNASLDYLFLRFDQTTYRVTCRVDQGGVNKVLASTTDAIDGNGICYLVMEYNGSYMRWGFIDSGSPTPNTKPTSWADFNANDKREVAATFSLSDVSDRHDFFGHYLAVQPSPTGNWYYFAAKKSAVF